MDGIVELWLNFLNKLYSESQQQPPVEVNNMLFTKFNIELLNEHLTKIYFWHVLNDYNSC